MAIQSKTVTTYGVIGAGGGTAIWRLDVTVTENSVSTSNNTSSVTLSSVLTAYTGYGGTASWSRLLSASSRSGSTSVSSGSTKTLETTSFTIKHDAAGQKLLSFEVSVTLGGVTATAKGNMTLTPIAQQKYTLNPTLTVSGPSGGAGSASPRQHFASTYLQGIDGIVITLTGMGANGGVYPKATATIKQGASVLWTSSAVGGASTVKITTPALSVTGTVSISVTVDASNAVSAVTRTASVTYTAYSPPSLTFTAYRAPNGSTSPSVTAEYVYAAAAGASTLTGNTVSVAIKIGGTSVTSGSWRALSASDTAEATAVATDLVGMATSKTIIIGLGFAFVQVKGDMDGFGIGIGRVPTEERIQSALAIEAPNLFSLVAAYDEEIPTNANLNDSAYWVAGKWWRVPNATKANTLTNYPHGRAAINARVGCINLNITADGSTENLLQFYINGDCTFYVRRKQQSITAWLKFTTTTA